MNIYQKTSIIVLGVLLFCAQQSQAISLECSKIFTDIESDIKIIHDKKVDANKFQTGRNIYDYLGGFDYPAVQSARFIKTARGFSVEISQDPDLNLNVYRSLAKLNSQSHIMDGGAGQMIAINDLLFKVKDLLSSKFLDSRNLALSWHEAGTPNFTGVTMVPVINDYFASHGNFNPEGYTGSISYSKLVNTGKVNAQVGRYFEEIPNEELIKNFGLVDFYFDVFGILSYSNHTDIVGQKLAAILKPGAELWIQNLNASFNFYVNGEALGPGTLIEYFEKSGAFELIGKSPNGVAVFRRTGNPWDLDLSHIKKEGN